MKRWKASALALGLLALGAIAGVGLREAHRETPVARAADRWTVQAGGSAPGGYEANEFYPKVLTVRAGDTVDWVFRDFHTVTFDAGQPSLPDFLPGQNGDLIGGPALFPFPPGPMPPSGPYDGRRQISSGPPLSDDDPPFSLTFTATGVFGYVCVIHPGMFGVISVVPEDGTLPQTPAQASALGTRFFLGDIDEIRLLVENFRPATGAARDGDSVAAVTAGLQAGGGASAHLFLPNNVTIKSGGVVVWTVADPSEIHTVTFLGGAPVPDFPEIVPPSQPGPPTLIFRAHVVAPTGGSRYGGSGYLNSGIIGPGGSVIFMFDTPPGEYEYICIIHPEMKGKVTVTP